MRVPRYEHRSLANVLPSLASALGDSAQPNTLQLPDLSQAVLLVVDGLGYEQLDQAQDHIEHLNIGGHEPLDAAFPTTTPVGLATLTLAMTPGVHGFVGATFELPDFERVLNPLHWESEPAPEAVQPESNVFSRIAGIEVRSHGPSAYATSGMTRTLLHKAEQCPYDVFSAGVIEPHDSRLDYVYLPQLDKVGHTDGPMSSPWLKTLREIDRLVGQIRKRLPASAAVFVTGDHGMVSIDDVRRINVDGPEFQAAVRLMAGEPRMRHLYTPEPDRVCDQWQQLLGDRARVLTRDAALDAGLFGAFDEFVTDRIGDVIAIASEGWALTSRDVDPRVSGLRGLHGGVSAAELLVPALVLPGVA